MQCTLASVAQFPHLPELAPRVKEDLDTMRLWLRRDNGGNERAYAPEARCLLEQHCAFETQALNIAERVKLDAKLGLGCDSELGPPVLPLLPTLKYQSMAGEAGCALWDLPDVLRAAASGENKKPNASQLRAIQTEGDKLMDRFEPLLQVYVLLLQARKNSAKPAADKGNVAAGDSAGPSHKKQKQ